MPRQYDLNTLHGSETQWQRYVRLTVGENTSAWALLQHELVLGLCTGLPGLLGLGVRNRIYSWLFRGFHRQAFVGKQVLLRCPRQITLGDGVVIDDFAQLVATSSREDAIAMGSGSSLRSFAMVNAGPPEGFVHIGSNTSIGQATVLYGNGGLTIGDNVLIAGQCFIVASSHNHEDLNQPISRQGFSAAGITIGDGVWVGAGARILDGVSIGEGAIIGANAVVNHSVAPRAKVGGIPARVL